MPGQDVFISHATADRKLVEALCDGLDRAKVSYWVSFRHEKPGDIWSGAISRATRESHLFLLVFTVAANASVNISGSFGEFMGKLFLKPAAGSLRAPQVAEWVAQLQRLGSAEGKWTAEYRRQEG